MSALTMAPTVVVGGRKWSLFDVDYDTPDGKFSFYIYALSDEHASMIVEEIKATARVSGQVLDFVQPGSDK